MLSFIQEYKKGYKLKVMSKNGQIDKMEEDKVKDFQKNWQDLIKPKRIEKEERSATPFYSKFICEPLERGYGVTLG